jgi:hypothetical protein
MLNKYYREVFYEDEFRPLEDQVGEPDNSKVYKIKYSLNLLTSIGMYIKINHDIFN